MALQIEIRNHWVRNSRIDNEARWTVVVIILSETESEGVNMLMPVEVDAYPGGKNTAWCLRGT